METALSLIVIPICAALLSMRFNGGWLRKLVALLHWAQLGFLTWKVGPIVAGMAGPLQMTTDFSIDKMAGAFILLTAVITAICTTQADCFFEGEEQVDGKKLDYRLFYMALNLFAAGMTFVFMCNNLGYLWISIEATTLSSAPLVYFDRTKTAVEATWKYLIICSVGIAFALLGTVLIFASSQHGAIVGGSLDITELLHHASSLDFSLLRLGFIFCLMGYGTKAGIFPLHTWMPDAYSEAPAPASAMLSGALTNCALYGIWRVTQIVQYTQHRSLTYEMVTYLGAMSILAAGIMLIRQHGFKRMWAYSSIENVGLMLVAIGLGSGPLFFLQALNHSLAKVSAFLLTGNITQAAATKKLSNLHGIIRSAPPWGILLALSALAVAGVPPFGSFVSELAIMVNGADAHLWPVVIIMILGLTITFIALSAHVGKILAGAPRPNFNAYAMVRSSLLPSALIVASIILGVTLKPEVWMQLQ